MAPTADTTTDNTTIDKPKSDNDIITAIDYLQSVDLLNKSNIWEEKDKILSSLNSIETKISELDLTNLKDELDKYIKILKEINIDVKLPLAENKAKGREISEILLKLDPILNNIKAEITGTKIEYDEDDTDNSLTTELDKILQNKSQGVSKTIPQGGRKCTQKYKFNTRASKKYHKRVTKKHPKRKSRKTKRRYRHKK